MKKILLLLLIVLNSCSDTDNSNSTIVSKWKLAAILSDPGDGSGTFQPVVSEKCIEFYSHGTFYSNGSLCSTSIASDSNSTGTYSFSTNVLFPSQCQQDGFQIFMEITDSNLILSYPCFEPCSEKYIQISNTLKN